MSIVWSKEFVSVDDLHYVEVRVYAAEPPWPSLVRLTTDEELCLTSADTRRLAQILDDAAQIAEIESASDADFFRRETRWAERERADAETPAPAPPTSQRRRPRA